MKTAQRLSTTEYGGAGVRLSLDARDPGVDTDHVLCLDRLMAAPHATDQIVLQ